MIDCRTARWADNNDLCGIRYRNRIRSNYRFRIKDRSILKLKRRSGGEWINGKN